MLCCVERIACYSECWKIMDYGVRGFRLKKIEIGLYFVCICETYGIRKSLYLCYIICIIDLTNAVFSGNDALHYLLLLLIVQMSC